MFFMQFRHEVVEAGVAGYLAVARILHGLHGDGFFFVLGAVVLVIQRKRYQSAR